MSNDRVRVLKDYSRCSVSDSLKTGWGRIVRQDCDITKLVFNLPHLNVEETGLNGPPDRRTSEALKRHARLSLSREWYMFPLRIEKLCHKTFHLREGSFQVSNYRPLPTSSNEFNNSSNLARQPSRFEMTMYLCKRPSICSNFNTINAPTAIARIRA